MNTVKKSKTSALSIAIEGLIFHGLYCLDFNCYRDTIRMKLYFYIYFNSKFNFLIRNFRYKTMIKDKLLLELCMIFQLHLH